MYTLVVNENNEIITTIKERIMQRSKLVDTLHFLVDPAYKGHDMSTFTVKLDYLLPISKEAVSDTLVMSAEMYKDKLEYKLPIDTSLTKEAGKIELNLTFVKLEMDSEGNVIQRVRKAGPASITIIPLSAWTNVVPDGALNAIDQRLIMAEAMINAANDFNQYLYENKADNIAYNANDRSLQLMSNGSLIGDKIVLPEADGGIVSIRIDDENNMIVNYADGHSETIGKINASDCTGVYIPSCSDDGMLTFTLSDKAEDPVYTFDIDRSNDWHEIDSQEQDTNFIWEQI